MTTSLFRTRALPAGLLAAAFWLLTLAAAFAQDKPAPVPKGEYAGTWANEKAKFNVLEVHGDSHFDGVAELIEGPQAGLKFGVHGEIKKDGALVLTRYTGGGQQVGRSGPPRLRDGHRVYGGPVKGIGVGEAGEYAFELRLPQPAAEKGGPIRVAEGMIRSGDYQGAVDVLTKHLAKKPAPAAAAYVARGQALHRLYRFDKAEEDFTSALKIARRMALAYSYRAMARAEQFHVPKEPKQKEALEDIEKAFALAPKDPMVLVHRGTTYRLLAKLAEAKADLDLAVERHPKLADAYLHRGLLRISEKSRWVAVTFGDGKTAMQVDEIAESVRNGLPDLERARQLDPGRAFILDRCVHCYLRLNLQDRAIEGLKAVLKLSPHRLDYANSLAWLLATSHRNDLRDGDAALRLALKASEAAGGKDAFRLDTLAAACAEKGDFAKAIEKQKEVLRLLKMEEKGNPFADRLALYRSDKPFRTPPGDAALNPEPGRKPRAFGRAWRFSSV